MERRKWNLEDFEENVQKPSESEGAAFQLEDYTGRMEEIMGDSRLPIRWRWYMLYNLLAERYWERFSSRSQDRCGFGLDSGQHGGDIQGRGGS